MNIRLPYAPLTDEQLQQLNNLLQGLDGWQVDWLSGYLSGYRAAQSGAEATPSLTKQSIKLTILYGSQTGNTEAVAGLLAEKAKASGIDVNLLDMGEYKPRELKNERYLAVLTSTHGEGEPPDNAMDLYEFLNSRKAPSLKELQYSVLSLGDSSYEYFCQTGIDFDERLKKLGATDIIPRVDCDVDYDDLVEKWITDLTQALTSSIQASVAPPSASTLMTQPAVAKVQYDRKHPFPAPLLENQLLSGRGSSKEVRHIEISLEGSGLQYQPGDALGIYPQNDPILVGMLIDTLGFDPDSTVEFDEHSETLVNALMHHREITILTRPLIEKWVELSQAKGLAKLAENKSVLTEWLRGRDVLDLVQSYPLSAIEPDSFIKLLRKLPPRLYSIASSQAAVDEEVHITVATVRYPSYNRERGGVASTWLSDRLTEDATIPVYIDANKNFKLPADDVPIIMIGPGTGIAPFRSFMQEREERDARGSNWLFFGDQHFLTDFLYQTEWLGWRKSGLLTHLDVAFSRDQTEKVYVQHRIREKSIEIWNWLQDGAHIYVCGDADNMAPDVNEALIDIICEHGQKNRDDATEYLRQLTRDKRYQRDVY